jgi:hypothetical protein
MQVVVVLIEVVVGLSFFVHELHECSRIMGPATAGPVRALAWSADLVSSFASFRDMADVVGKRVREAAGC